MYALVKCSQCHGIGRVTKHEHTQCSYCRGEGAVWSSEQPYHNPVGGFSSPGKKSCFHCSGTGKTWGPVEVYCTPCQGAGRVPQEIAWGETPRQAPLVQQIAWNENRWHAPVSYEPGIQSQVQLQFEVAPLHVILWRVLKYIIVPVLIVIVMVLSAISPDFRLKVSMTAGEIRHVAPVIYRNAVSGAKSLLDIGDDPTTYIRERSPSGRLPSVYSTDYECGEKKGKALLIFRDQAAGEGGVKLFITPEGNKASKSRLIPLDIEPLVPGFTRLKGSGSVPGQGILKVEFIVKLNAKRAPRITGDLKNADGVTTGVRFKAVDAANFR